ncbi:MAG: DUF523 and DUF1722 domain-containing protein [Methanomassiliicoccus sp.]|nr:DUF523 and DUF1722 domain-containing protein [Methanomassiliicoccus sp.]
MASPRSFPRPRLGISRCIEFDHCRYNGDMISSEFVRRLMDHADLVPVCPEVAIELGVPRDPIRIVLRGGERHLVQPSTGRDLTSPMASFTTEFLDRLGVVDGFILKSRSPSCGARDVRAYPDRQGAVPQDRGAGMFGQEVLRRLDGLAVEDEARLRNIKLGEHFLTRAFTLRSFRELNDESEMSDLIDFHSRHKLLLMMYNQTELRRLGRVVANRSGNEMGSLLDEYRDHLRKALTRPPGCTSPINVLSHAFGYVSERLRKDERDLFLQNLDMYREARVPLSVCLSLMRSYIIRFDVEYLAAQAFFEPFPPGILSVGVTDSCEWREMA